MDMTAQPKFTPDEFIAWEWAQESKHELVDGRVVAFAGGTLAHAHVASRLIQEIGPAVSPCRTSGSDAFVQTGRSLRYPDVAVSCDERDRGPATTCIAYPKLIVEVLSESTAAVDRGEKLDEYRSIATLEEYVLIDSRKRWSETYRKVDGAWIASLPVSSGILRLESIGLSIDLDTLYEYAAVAAET